MILKRPPEAVAARSGPPAAHCYAIHQTQDIMRLPGTRYQEHGWEQVRKLLGHCSLQAFGQIDLRQVLDPGRHALLLDCYTDATAAALRSAERSARAEAPGNSYGDSVGELALSLLFELQAHPAFWQAFVAVLAADHARSGEFWRDGAADGPLRKKVNDMYASLRDKVDADNYIVATGRDCSPNKIYSYRMLDTAYRDIADLFANWELHQQQVGEIIGRAPAGIPIEVRQMRHIGGCKAEWIIRWSASQERFRGAPGPLHTKSKRFASLKNNPDKIAAMLGEIGDYEELSSNLDRGEDWQGAAGEAALWLEDYWRVVGESEQQEAEAEEDVSLPDVVDQILAAPDIGEEEGEDETTGCELSGIDPDDSDEQDDRPQYGVTHRAAPRSDGELAAEQAAAAALSLPPRYMELARAAQDEGSWTARVLASESLPIRLAVYHKLLGTADDSYPGDWLDPATNELPSLQQLAGLDGISMPTLRKRRNEAIDKLYAANAASAQRGRTT